MTDEATPLRPHQAKRRAKQIAKEQAHAGMTNEEAFRDTYQRAVAIGHAALLDEMKGDLRAFAAEHPESWQAKFLSEIESEAKNV